MAEFTLEQFCFILMDQPYAKEIKNIWEHFLGVLEIPFQVKKVDPSFYNDCLAAAEQRDIPVEIIGPTTFEMSCELAALSYGHLLRYDRKVYMALYTAVVTAIDDVCKNHIDLLNDFSSKFIKNEKHGHPLLVAYDSLMREIPNLYDPGVAQIMLHSASGFLIGLTLEYEINLQTEGPTRPVGTRAKQFPTFMRGFSGIPTLYAVMVFPEGIALSKWVEALPPLGGFIIYVNDIFSFYKEELANESNNYISVRAQSSGKSKLEALQILVDEVIESYKEILGVLSHTQQAQEAYKNFCKGYIYLHLSSKRYRVAEACTKGSEVEEVNGNAVTGITLIK